MSTGRPIHPRPSARLRMFAGRMRRALTVAEKRLWWELRHRVLLRKSHFRRQVVVGDFIVDFCNLGAKLVIEVDGGQHYSDEAALRDNDRTAALARQGFRVLRFTNSAVLSDIDCVIETIVAHLPLQLTGENGATPTPDPSPQGGGENPQRS